jgi:hypothetical protein
MAGNGATRGNVTAAAVGGIVTLAVALLLLVPSFPSRAEVRTIVGDVVPGAVQSECQPGWEAVQAELRSLRTELTGIKVELAVWRDRWERSAP